MHGGIDEEINEVGGFRKKWKERAGDWIIFWLTWVVEVQVVSVGVGEGERVGLSHKV